MRNVSPSIAIHLAEHDARIGTGRRETAQCLNKRIAQPIVGNGLQTLERRPVPAVPGIADDGDFGACVDDCNEKSIMPGALVDVTINQ